VDAAAGKCPPEIIALAGCKLFHELRV